MKSNNNIYIYLFITLKFLIFITCQTSCSLYDVRKENNVLDSWIYVDSTIKLNRNNDFICLTFKTSNQVEIRINENNFYGFYSRNDTLLRIKFPFDFSHHKRGDFSRKQKRVLDDFTRLNMNIPKDSNYFIAEFFRNINYRNQIQLRCDTLILGYKSLNSSYKSAAAWALTEKMIFVRKVH